MGSSGPVESSIGAASRLAADRHQSVTVWLLEAATSRELGAIDAVKQAVAINLSHRINSGLHRRGWRRAASRFTLITAAWTRPRWELYR